MKVSWQKRATSRKNESYIHKCFAGYQVPNEESVKHFINNWVMTFDPRLKTDKVIPLELYPRQEEYINWLWARFRGDESGVVDKCRTAGASWVTIAFFVYLFLFQKDVSLQIYTYKAEECHKLGDISTLLEKAIFIIKRLPPLFIEGVKTSHMYLKNSKMGSDIAGSAGDNPGRGSRRTMIMTDEESFYQRAELIEAALSETSNCRISVSTHSGTSSLFYRKCQSSMAKFIFDWWHDPRLDQEWFDKKKADAIEKGLLHVFKREIERDAAASLDAVAVPSDWVSAASRCDIKHTGKIIAGLDPANEGGDTHGFVAIDGNIPIYADESGDGDPGDATDKFFWKAVELGVSEFRYDPIGVGAGVKVRIKEILKQLPPDHKARNIKIVPWSASGAVLRPDAEDYQDKTNKDLFENAKAQAWWKIREEFRHTYRYVNDKEEEDFDDSVLIHTLSDPDRMMQKLFQEISQPQYKMSASGKTMIDKKPKGTRSPNLADAYVICRAETTPTWIAWSEV